MKLRRKQKKRIYQLVSDAYQNGERDPEVLENLARTALPPVISALLIQLAVEFVRFLLESYFNKTNSPAATCPEEFLTDAIGRDDEDEFDDRDFEF